MEPNVLGKSYIEGNKKAHYGQLFLHYGLKKHIMDKKSTLWTHIMDSKSTFGF